MIVTLLTMVLVTVMIAIIVRQTTADTSATRTQAILQQQDALARTGLNVGRTVAFTSLHDRLANIVNNTANFGETGYYDDPGSLLNNLQGAANDLLCESQNPDGFTTGELQVMIYFRNDSRCANGRLPPANLTIPDVAPLSTTSGGIQVYEVPFIITSRASLGGVQRVLTQPGAYRIALGEGGLNYYVLLGNNTSNITVDRATPIDGPMHSNTVWWLAGRAWVGDTLTSSGCQEGTSCGTASADLGTTDGSTRKRLTIPELTPSPDAPCSGGFCPALTAGVDYNAPQVTFPTNADLAAAANSGGLVISGDVYEMILDGRNGQQTIQTCDRDANCFTYRLTDTGSSITLQRKLSDTDWEDLIPNFNGIIYAEGNIERLHSASAYAPAYTSGDDSDAADSSFTVAARGDIRITSSIRSDAPACSTHITRNSEGKIQVAQCENAGPENTATLGLFSAEGDIVIGRATAEAMEAPPSVTIHAALMASRGTLAIEPPDGQTQEVRLLGSLAAYTLPALTNDTHTLLLDYDPRFGINTNVKPRGFPKFSAAYLNATTQVSNPRTINAE